MSSFKNAQKSNQKAHRERRQPSARAHLGLLEKKKDYKLRADDYQRKQKTLKALKRQALDKNPDEFYFKMVRSKLEDGVHSQEEAAPQYTEQQLKLMTSQDSNYVKHKLSVERKKIEKLKSNLHMLDAAEKPKNSHTIFVDSKKEARSFNAAKHFDTHPALLGRAYNRPRLETLKKADFGGTDDLTLAELAYEREKKYKELGKRIDREKQLHVTAQKMQMKKNLRQELKVKKKKVAEETKDAPAQYKWVPHRKR